MAYQIDNGIDTYIKIVKQNIKKLSSTININISSDDISDLRLNIDEISNLIDGISKFEYSRVIGDIAIAVKFINKISPDIEDIKTSYSGKHPLDEVIEDLDKSLVAFGKDNLKLLELEKYLELNGMDPLSNDIHQVIEFIEDAERLYKEIELVPIVKLKYMSFKININKNS